jgi:ADP-ribose pyrophosphatase
LLQFRWNIENFNKLGKKNDRRSFTGTYFVDPITNRPRNPMGRTGCKKKDVQFFFTIIYLVTGRGRLYYWGPNHAGDPVVTRWVRDKNGSIVYRRVNAHEHPKPVLEFVAIQRRDTKQWALPGVRKGLVFNSNINMFILRVWSIQMN